MQEKAAGNKEMTGSEVTENNSDKGFRQESKAEKCDFNSVRLDSCAVPSHHVAHSMLHMISARYVAPGFHTVASLRLSVRVEDSMVLDNKGFRQ